VYQLKANKMKKCTYTLDQYPVLEGLLKEICSSRKEREELINLGLSNFNFLVEYNVEFRLCYLGQKIKEYTTDNTALLIADVMIVNSAFYMPWIKSVNNGIYQIDVLSTKVYEE